MNSIHVKVEDASFASELQERVEGFRSTMTTALGMSGVSYVHPATRYSVTFEMTIKPLPEEPSISASHPHTDGSER
jgi:hypothetical protein